MESIDNETFDQENQSIELQEYGKMDINSNNYNGNIFKLSD